MKIKEQTRKLATGSQNTVLRLRIGLTWFEEIFEEYKMMGKAGQLVFFDVYRLVRQVS
ncbi:N-ethylammeline chlorohydrolase [Streptococcus pneumoniae]|nr:N-ethylammeline chlorohydrolase [Streptococcus pneumoniae]